MGRNLTLDISEEIATEINPSQGKPGIYKEDGNVVTLSVNDPGEDFIANKTYSTVSSISGLGLTIRVTEVDAVSGEILAFIIATSGANYEVGEIITIPSPVFGSPNAILQVDEVGVANPLGWYTYKVVVKQQEQEYYNVFLPGFVNGLPICNQVWDGVNNQTSSSPAVSTCSKVDSIQTERGKIAFATLLSENVNKIPRSLDEVGPTDLEFNSDEILFIRVNNPNVLGVTGNDPAVYDQIDAVNKQYYPNQLQQNVLTIETVRESELQAVPFKKFRRSPNRSNWPYVVDEITGHAVPCTYGVGGLGPQEYTQKSGFKGEYNSNVLVADGCLVEDSGPPIKYSGNVFNVSSGSIPWGDVGDTAPFYGADQNPFIIKIGQVTNYENPVGAIVAGPPLENQGCAAPNNIIPHDSNWPTEDGEGLRSMRPILSIAETKPVFSLLDIFWESTLSGKLEVLNSSISSNYNGVVSCSISEVDFPEDASSGDTISSSFNFVNGSGASATVSNVSIVSLYTEQSPNVQLVPSDYFTIVPNPKIANEFVIETTKEYWYRQDSISSGADIYIASLQVESSSGAETFTDILTDAITLTLENDAPQIYNDAGYSNNVTGTNIVIPSNPDYPDTPPVTVSEILTLWGLNGSVDTNNYKKQILWEVEGALGTPTTDFELIAGPDEGSIILKNTVELTPEVPYSLTIKATDANNGLGALTSEVGLSITFGTRPAPRSISTPASVWAAPSSCPAKYTSSHYPAFGGVMKSGEFRFTRTDSTYIVQDCADSGIQTILPGATLPSVTVPYYCFNVCGGTTSSIYANGGGFDDETPPVGCPVTEKGRGDLFQGTLDLKIFTEKVSTNVSSGDTPTTRFVIQYRANSGDAWSYIDSVPVSKPADPNASDEIYDSTTPIVILGPSKLANDPQCTKIGVRYKFDQLGEYRVVCSTTEPRS